MQCNSISNVTAELKIEINLLLSERDNDNFDNDFVHLKKINFRGSGKGKPYIFKLRNLYYNFRSQNIGLLHIAQIIQYVLDE